VKILLKSLTRTERDSTIDYAVVGEFDAITVYNRRRVQVDSTGQAITSDIEIVTFARIDEGQYIGIGTKTYLTWPVEDSGIGLYKILANEVRNELL